MDFMYDLEDRLMEELKEISNKDHELTAECLDNIKDLTSSINHIETIMAMKNGGFSQDSGVGYSQGRSSQRRDSMGRYSRGGYNRYSYGRMEDDWGREPYGMY